MVNFIIGLTAGFITGVGYAERHERPWHELKTSLACSAIGAYRLVKGGPHAPTPEDATSEPPVGAEQSAA